MEESEVPESTADTAEGSPVRQVSLFLHNRSGALLSILDLLRTHQIIVLGLSVQDSIDVTVLRLVSTDPDQVETLFMEKGIAFTTTELVVVELAEGAAQMPDCVRTLVNAETNIHFIYPLLTRPNGQSALALCVEDNDFGQSVLVEAGYKVLRQEDLSR